MNLSIVVNVTQVGIAMDLHGYREEPLMLELLSYRQLTEYRRTLEQSNPDMRYAVIGQVALMLAKRMYPELPVTLSR